jgi:S-DNA-T family DNA segregation ATPase FtsK/SpoIIIE
LAKKNARAGSSGKRTARTTARGTKRTAGKQAPKTKRAAASKTRRTADHPGDSRIRDEVIFLIVLAFSILLFLSGFGLSASFGTAIARFFFGLFGLMEYIFPILLVFVYLFVLSNRGNPRMYRKMGGGAGLFVFLCAFFQLVIMHYDRNTRVVDLFLDSAYEKSGGGLLGGLIVQLFGNLFGTVGAYVCVLIGLVIFAILMTQEPLLRHIRLRSEEAYETAVLNRQQRREELRAKQEAEEPEPAYEQMSFEFSEDAQAPSPRKASFLHRQRGNKQAGSRSAARDEIPFKEAHTSDTFANRPAYTATAGARDHAAGRSQTGAESSYGQSAAASSLFTEGAFGGNPSADVPEYQRADPSSMESIRASGQALFDAVSKAGEKRPKSEPRIRGIFEDESPESFEESDDSSGLDAYASSAEVQESGDLSDADPMDLIEAARRDPAASVTGNRSGAQGSAVPGAGFDPQTSSAFGGQGGSSSGARSDRSDRNRAGANAGSSDGQTQGAASSGSGDVSKTAAAAAKQKAVSKFRFPPLNLMNQTAKSGRSEHETRDELRRTADKLQQTLHNFGVEVQVTDVSCGPTVTRYELHPEQGVKVSRILNLQDDIKLNLAAADIRIEAPIPGKAAVGIEVPNQSNSTVGLRELLESRAFRQSRARIPFAVGKDIAGKTVVTDITKMPHLLIAGATGSGKSVCINTLIVSILYRLHPDDVKFIMIDPKMVELSVYNGIPHLFIPVVTDPKKAAGALNWAVSEMIDRYNKFAGLGVRDIDGYNAKIAEKAAQAEEGAEPPHKMARIVIIVDELADLMMVAQHEVEDAIVRLSQLARAAGIHLIIATQRPSVNVITGLIKANMPSRIALAVTSGVDSRTILDMNGAEKLLGKGDMLFYPQGYQKPAASRALLSRTMKLLRLSPS